ncbi:hypothetical protein VTK73DRAFT_4024 [Phialemonium thermophilum]|uniref:DUF1993 domain-containing protein n=1 Tax=Phialemonium thermophilum TaxID=223376 RepID=A0ABR3WWN1_9PEZI
MSDFTFYDGSIALIERALHSLLAILNKAAQHPDAASFPGARLADDMKPLTFQVHTVCDLARKTVFRLTGAPVQPLEDKEQTMAELIAKTESALALVKTVDPKQIQEAAGRQVELGLGAKGSVNLSGKGYVLGFALPNVFFHLQTAYAILRMKGVPLGKADYLESFMQPVLP